MEPGSYTLRPTRWLTEGAVPGADMLALVAEFDSEGVGVRCGAGVGVGVSLGLFEVRETMVISVVSTVRDVVSF
jgi:hypothetical protein